MTVGVFVIVGVTVGVIVLVGVIVGVIVLVGVGVGVVHGQTPITVIVPEPTLRTGTVVEQIYATAPIATIVSVSPSLVQQPLNM